MKKILKEFKETDDTNNIISVINKVANLIKPDPVQKVIVKHTFTDGGVIFVRVTYICPVAKPLILQNLTSVIDDLLAKWTKILIKNVEDYLGLKLVIYNTKILAEE